jgi:hypothetical protein
MAAFPTEPSRMFARLSALLLLHHATTWPSEAVHWEMNLDWYRRIRAASGIPNEDDDPETWLPNPEDRLFGLRIVVAENGGEPHTKRTYPPVPDGIVT